MEKSRSQYTPPIESNGISDKSGIEPEVVEQPTNSSLNPSTTPLSSYTNVDLDHSYHSPEQIDVQDLPNYGTEPEVEPSTSTTSTLNSVSAIPQSSNQNIDLSHRRSHSEPDMMILQSGINIESTETEDHPTTLAVNTINAEAEIFKKIVTIKNWSVATYKYTRQLTLEKLGKSTKTIDSEMDLKIAQIRATQRDYLSILRLTRALSLHFIQVVQTQASLAETFAELSQRSPELQHEFFHNSESQRNLTKNGGILLNALNSFISTVDVLCNKTFNDTLLTIKKYEIARIEFDAYRIDLEGTPSTIASPALDNAKKNYFKHKESYDKLRTTVAEKLQLLDENRIKVMHTQLLMLHNAVAAYFSGNAEALEDTLKHFNIKIKKSPADENPSWLEKFIDRVDKK